MSSIALDFAKLFNSWCVEIKILIIMSTKRPFHINIREIKKTISELMTYR